MPYTDAGFRLTSIDRRCSWRTVAGPVVAVELGAAPACARAIVGRTVATAKADASTTRRVGMVRSPGGIGRISEGGYYLRRPGCQGIRRARHQPRLVRHQYRNRHVIEKIAANAANQRFAQRRMV